MHQLITLTLLSQPAMITLSAMKLLKSQLSDLKSITVRHHTIISYTLVIKVGIGFTGIGSDIKHANLSVPTMADYENDQLVSILQNYSSPSQCS